MQLINLTPHAIVIRLPDGDREIPASGSVARVATSHVPAGTIDGIPVFDQTFGEIEGLPEPQEGVVFIVSAIVLAAAKELGRTDVVAPDTARAIRNEDGQIVAVPGLVW